MDYAERRAAGDPIGSGSQSRMQGDLQSANEAIGDALEQERRTMDS